MDYLMGVGIIAVVIVLFSLVLTFAELMDRLESGGKIAPLWKYWPIPIWSIFYNGLIKECKYGRIDPFSTSRKKKGGKDWEIKKM